MPDATQKIRQTSPDGHVPKRPLAAAAAGFGDALGHAFVKLDRKAAHASATSTQRELPAGPPAQTVAFQHKGRWYSEDPSGAITQLSAAPTDPGVKVVADRCGLFNSADGYVYRNTVGVVADAKRYDPMQAGYFRTGSGAWGYLNAWGNVALEGRSGQAITPPRGANIIELG